jgi:CHAT domain
MMAAEEFGGALFEELFREGLRDALTSSLVRAPEGLRIRLRLNAAPKLAELPWELLYDKATNRFLAQSERTPLIRYLDLPQPPAPLRVAGPLNVLVIIASPDDLAPLDADREWEVIREAVAKPLADGSLQLNRLMTASLPALQVWLRHHDVHVLHFIGHGAFDAAQQDGVLYFVNDRGHAKPVGTSLLGPHIHDHEPLRLVVLNACQTGRGDGLDPFSGLAQGLVQQGIPAVVATQFPITDGASICLTGNLYAALSTGQPADQAVSGSRKALLAEHGPEWATPVLFMRAADGYLFARPDEPLASAAFLSPETRSRDEVIAEPDAGAPETTQLHLPPRAATRKRRRIIAAVIAAVAVITAVAATLIYRAVSPPGGNTGSPSLVEIPVGATQARSPSLPTASTSTWRITTDCPSLTHPAGP